MYVFINITNKPYIGSVGVKKSRRTPKIRREFVVKKKNQTKRFTSNETTPKMEIPNELFRFFCQFLVRSIYKLCPRSEKTKISECK